MPRATLQDLDDNELRNERQVSSRTARVFLRLARLSLAGSPSDALGRGQLMELKALTDLVKIAKEVPRAAARLPLMDPPAGPGAKDTERKANSAAAAALPAPPAGCGKPGHGTDPTKRRAGWRRGGCSRGAASMKGRRLR